MRVGIVGTGFMGRTHVAGWAATPAEIVGFVSKDEGTAVALQKQYGGQIYPDLASLLQDVDVVDICAPTHRHYEMVLQAAAAGKDIICEKPLARTLPQAKEMVEVCEKAGVKLLVAHVVRYFPEYAQAKAQVAANAIGQPAVIRLTRGTFQPKKAADNWFVDFEKSGGMMLDLMIHDFDYARWIAGDVVQVYAKSIGNNAPGAAVDHGLAILTHQNGAISHIEGSWAYPPPLFRTRLEIAGDNGWIQFDSEQMTAIKLHLHQQGDDSADVPIPGSPMLEDPYTTQIKAFYDHITNDAPVAVTAVDGYKALEIALAAIESAQTGKPVKIGEDLS
ncbi:MAG: Gfo/Idh/MocA family oxidoreductase [Ardenticatenaceae bacterium]|nr:Gfo/Idh/MocA family oxidoreductase [Ardenticatenaceae bacterium]MCB9445043.1 Gfo/Idh/MocA family oxidoreductase [Ardenticatenaceae bacterium]